MTFKYIEVKKEIFSLHSKNPIKRFRTINEIKELFTAFHWIILVLAIIVTIMTIICTFVFKNELLGLGLSFIMFALSVIFDWKGEKHYNKSKRAEEIKTQKKLHNAHIEKVKRVLKECNITNEKHITLLKAECLERLQSYDKKYKSLTNNVVEILLILPISMFITSLINGTSDAMSNQIEGVLIVGVVLFSFVIIFKKLIFFYNGFHKDKYLLNCLKDIEYYME